MQGKLTINQMLQFCFILLRDILIKNAYMTKNGKFSKAGAGCVKRAKAGQAALVCRSFMVAAGRKIRRNTRAQF